MDEGFSDRACRPAERADQAPIQRLVDTAPNRASHQYLIRLRSCRDFFSAIITRLSLALITAYRLSFATYCEITRPCI
jgi:hypothetical protein